MTRAPPFLGDPDDTRAAIMTATYHALRKHGYANLTTQHIADEFEKSKSLLYHHYEGKDELLLDFLDFMLERFENRIPFPQDQSETEYLDAILDRVLVTPIPEDYRDFSKAMVELRAQAAHDPEYRDYFTRSDQFFRKQLAHVVRAGVERGVFRDVDPARTAAMLQSLIIGTMTQRVTNDDDLTEPIRAELDRYLRECVYSDDPVE
jgi:AcrR family transcriptional regulator